MERCAVCDKPLDLCLCAEVHPFSTKQVLVLQHPQEPDKELGTARLLTTALPNATLRVGLSWPNLAAALGREAKPSRWVALYLGSAKPPGNGPLRLVDKKGALLADGRAILADLDGIVVLDGTWSQAKTLWWRNAWLLKLRRGVLVPDRPSLYRELRREPRRECLSTIESVGLALTALGEPPEVRAELDRLFALLLQRYRQRPR